MQQNRQAKTLFPAGPYTFSRDKDGCDCMWNIYAPGTEKPIASIPNCNDDPTGAKVAEATARLLAAAPALLAALQMADEIMVLMSGRGYAAFPAGEEIRAAISSATETPFETSPGRTGSGAEIDSRGHLQAIANLLWHFGPAEQADYEATDGEQARDAHIYNDLRRLDGYLQALMKKSYL